MRARICSAFSCAMFARVVWLKPQRAAKPPILALLCAARTRHAWLARLTRARGGCFLRGWKALLNDFWYFSSLKSTIKEKYFYVSSRVVEAPTPTAQNPSTETEKNKRYIFSFSATLTNASRCLIPRKPPKRAFFFLFILYPPQKNYFRPTGFAQIRKENMISYSRGGYFGKSKADDGAD